MTLACCGLAVTTSQAIAIGPAHLLERGSFSVKPRRISGGEVAAEIARLEDALAATQRALRAVRDQIPGSTPLNVGEFIDSHLLMLQDAALVEPAHELIRKQLFCAE